jgi:polysaccharide export outer membrane protein
VKAPVPIRCMALVATGVALIQALGCASTGPYVWINELPDDPAALGDYVIAPGDTIAVHVFNQDNMSSRTRVRNDGKIAVQFLGDVDTRGKSPAVLAKELEGRFKEYVIAPKVTVTIEESPPTSISVVGEVAHAGVFTVDPTSSGGVLQALALAGGLTEYATRDSIYVLRRTPAQRIRFTYAALTRAEARAASFRLRAGDVVVVE